MKTGSLVLLVAALDLGFLCARSSSQGATITGQIVDARTRQPLRGAIVSAAKVPSNKPGDLPNIGFRTGQDGRFVLRGVAPGIVHFQVSKTGYLSGPYASVRPAVDGEQIDNVMLTVPPAAALGGRIVDESGQPVVGALVVMRGAAPSPVDATTKASMVGDSMRTDDDGQYWIGGLGAGDYSLTVRPSGDPIGSSAGGAVLSATVRGETLVTDPAVGGQFVNVKLEIGENVPDVNLVVRFPPIAGRPGRPLDKAGTGSVSGRVLDPSGRGVANVFVSISQDAKTVGSLVSTDSDGAFRFINVPAGSFTVSARGVRSVAAPSEPEGPSTASAVVAVGSQIENVVLTVRRGGAISGTITDEFGDPVSGTVIVIDPVRPNQGLTSEIIAVAVRYDGGLVASRGLVPTDARGRYRVTGLPPGEYLLGVATNDGVIAKVEVQFQDYGGNLRRLARANMYYPGVTTASGAARIPVSEGNDTSNIDFVVRPTPTANINVTITASRPVSEILLYQILLDDRLSVLEKATRITGTQAVTLDVRPGPYRLIASAKAAPGVDDIERLWSSVDVEADQLVPATVHLALEPAVTVTGRVIFEGTNPLRQDAGAWLIPLASFPGIGIDLDGNRTFTVTSGEFAIEGVFPGRYVIQAGGAERSSKSAYMLKGATLGGRDVLDEPIDLRPGEDIDDVRLTVTERISELSGRVADAADKPTRDDLVVVFSADMRHWWPGSRRTRIVRPDAKGMYKVRPLPPGPYIVTLVTDPISENDLPAKLPGLAGTGTRVTIGEGEQKVQDLRSARK